MKALGDLDHYGTRERHHEIKRNVKKFHKAVIKITELRDRTPSKIVNFHEQREITPEGMVRYRLSVKLKKTLWYLTM